MKKAILVTGIITIVSYSIAMLILGILGGVHIATNTMASSDPGAIDTPELLTIAIVCLSLAGYFLLGMIFAIILVAKRNSSMGKGAGIFLGFLGIIFSFLPGLLFTIDSAKSR